MNTQKSTFDGISDPNEWLHSSMGGNKKKLQKITIKNDDGDTTSLC